MVVNFLVKILLLNLLVGCAIHQPIQYVGGEIHPEFKHFERCEFAPFGFPAHGNVPMLVTVDDSEFKKDEIHSIDYTRILYLPYLLERHCVRVNANAALSQKDSGKKLPVE